MSHPLRLRLVAPPTFRELGVEVTLRALGARLRLNRTNDNYYLDNLERLSAHGQPALLANSARTLLVPVSEHGFSEVLRSDQTGRAGHDSLEIGARRDFTPRT